MGLDWNPGPKPKPGHKEEYLELYQRIDVADEDELGPLRERFEDITITAFETLNTPRVGYDAAATEWIREKYEEQKPDMTPEQWVEQFKGFYVLPLLPRCDGLPWYTNGYPGGYVEQYAFRAQFLKDCEDIIGEDLLNEGYGSKLPPALLIYGNALVARAKSYAVKEGFDLPDLDNEPPDDPDSDAFHLHTVISAGRWCIFWAERGHFLEAYW